MSSTYFLFKPNIEEGRKRERKKERKRGKEEWGKYQKIFLLFYPEHKISEQSRRIFLAHAYIHEICPKFLNNKTACSFIKI